MKVYDTLNQLASEIKTSEQYVEYKKMKEIIKTSPELKVKLDEFEKARYTTQLSAMQGQEPSREQIEQNHKDLDNSFAGWMGARSASDWRNWYDQANASGVRFSGDRISMGGSTDDYGIFGTRFNPKDSYNENWSKYFESLKT